MFNFVKVVIPNVRQCFIKLEHRIHLCSTLKALNETAPEAGSESKTESQEFDIFEIGRVHTEPFLSIKPIILHDIRTLNKPLNEPFINDRLIEVMDQENLVLMDTIRPLSIIGSCEILAKSRGHNLTDEEMFDIYRFGWIYKIFETHTLLYDDISDNHAVRAGKPSWWYKNNKNPVGSYDCLMLLHFYRNLLNKYFKDKFYYYDIQKIMNETVISYMCGEVLSAIVENVELLKTITLDAYHHIIAYKAGYNFLIPVYFGLHINGLYDEEDAEKICKISRIAGAKLQMWDDVIDCERDFAEGRSSWLAVLALEKANDSQKRILLDNYCKRDQKSISATKKIYEEIDVKTLVSDQRKKFQHTVETELQTLKNQEVRKILINLAGSIEKYH